jgi:type IV secretory pathway TrbF-like protein
MSSSTKPSPEITRAAERYLEQYGDPLVMNTYLKVTVLVLAGVCIALSALTFKSQQALANMHPMIVRINDVGHAEAIDYRNFQYRPQEAENKYYLTRWAELYFSRNRFTIERDQTQSLYFLNSDVQRRDRPGTQRQQHSELRQRQHATLCRCGDQERHP